MFIDRIGDSNTAQLRSSTGENRISAAKGRVYRRLAIGLAGALAIPAVMHDAAAEPSAAANKYLDGRLEAVLAKRQVPALSAVLVIDGQTVAVGVAGKRKSGSPNDALLTDAFHLGSVTKAMTGFLLGKLVEQGKMRWDMTIKEVFPEAAHPALGARAEHLKVTVAQLMAHEHGMKNQGDGSPNKSLTFRRMEYVLAAVKSAPQAPQYGGGVIIAAAMAERIMGAPWETLIQTHVFNPLGMTSIRMGQASPNGVSGIWEHSISGASLMPRPIPSAGQSAAEPHAPAGRNVHASIGDLAKFLAANMTYAKHRPNVLLQGTLTQTHNALGPGSNRINGGVYSQGGWQRTASPLGGPRPVITKNGLNGFNYSDTWVSPWENVAYATMTNVSAPRGNAALNDMNAELIALYQNWSSLADVSESYARGKSTTASNIFSAEFAADKATDGAFGTRWATTGGTKGAWLEVDLGQTYNNIARVIVSEAIPGRVKSFKIEYKAGPDWKTAASGTTMGLNKKLSFNPVAARYLRLNITDSTGGPTISEFMVLSQFSASLQ